MDTLYLKPTDQTPEVKLNHRSGVISLEGRSLPDNPFEFYEPILNWADEFFNSDEVPLDLKFDFKLEYYNTASSKQLAKLFKLMETSPASQNITVRWFYFEDDDDMLEAGQRYDMLINLDFEFEIMKDED